MRVIGKNTGWLGWVVAAVSVSVAPLLSSLQIAAVLSAGRPAQDSSKKNTGKVQTFVLGNATAQLSSASTDSSVPQYDAWLYPDAPGGLNELVTIGHVHVVRAEFLHVNDDGSMQVINQDASHPAGYSDNVVQTIAAHSDQRYITVSADNPDAMVAAMNNPATITQMVDFANKIHFGIELDWEGYGSWTPQFYGQFKTFLGRLGAALHANEHYLIVDGPPIYDSTSQGWYQWKYEDIAPLADFVTMMVYDNEYDTGVGGSIAPRAWAQSCLQWLKDKAGDKGIPGLAAYGYKGAESTGAITVNTSADISRTLQGQLTALNISGSGMARNADGELTQTVSGVFYDYSDKTTVQMRVQQAQDAGFNRISVWSLGGNPWPD